MPLSQRAENIYQQISSPTAKMGDLRKIAKEIKKDHELALELWSTRNFNAQLLATLIMDKKLLSQEVLDELDKDIQTHDYDNRLQLMDWLMANQLAKDKKTIALMESWQRSASALQRRTFWYYQARLRWMGKTEFDNTKALLDDIERDLLNEEPEVQWAMNYTAGQIGKWQKELRARCIAIGEKTGLYKDEIVPKNCTPSYLPEFIRIEVGKLEKV